LDNLVSENNLTTLIADVMQTKVKTLHSKEILLMEKEFQMNYDRLRNELEEVYHKEAAGSRDSIEEL
jgi:hypothetical protein